VQKGCVKVSWTVSEGEAGPRLSLTWTESGGPPVAPPQRKGFGSRLIERSLKGDLGGAATLDFAPEGLTCRIEAPLKGVE
jgi:two-component sensor histidine kinase